MLADRRPRAGARHVRSPALRVDQRLAGARQDRLAPEHVALHAARGRVVVDGERAERRRRLLLAVAQVGVAADEVVVLHLRPRHARLDHVVLGLELEPVGPVALLEPPGRAVDADPDGRGAVRARRPPTGCPRAARPAPSARRAPSPGRRRRRSATRARAACRSRSSRQDANGKPSCDTSSDVTDSQDVAGPRAPQAERRPAGRDVGELRAPVGRQVVGEPLLVGRAVRAAGDDAEELLAEPHDREVGLEAAARREDRGVDDPPDGHVHLPHRHALHGGERAGPGDVEDRKRAQVDHAGPVAHRQVLGVR